MTHPDTTFFPGNKFYSSVTDCINAATLNSLGAHEISYLRILFQHSVIVFTRTKRERTDQISHTCTTIETNPAVLKPTYHFNFHKTSTYLKITS